MIQRIVVPRILEPKKVKQVIKPKKLLIQNQFKQEEPKRLLVAVGAGGIPPSGNGPDNIPSSFKTPLSADFIKKINEMTKDMNKFTRKGFDIFNKFKK